MREHQLVGSWKVDGAPLGMDLSPDGNALLVADRAIGSASLHRIDLTTGELSSVVLPLFSGGSGTFSVAFIDDGRALVSPNALGSSGLWLLTLADGQARAIGSLPSQTLLISNADRSIIAYASTSGMYSYGRFVVADERFEEVQTQTQLFEVSIETLAEQLALASRGSLAVYDRAFGELGKVSVRGFDPFGVAHGASDELFVAWLQRDVSLPMRPIVEVYRASTLQRIAALDTTHTIGYRGPNNYVAGRLKASRDGRWLFANVDSGVVLYALRP
jgi:hypothetical protein